VLVHVGCRQARALLAADGTYEEAR
jgi:hypothetical protein